MAEYNCIITLTALIRGVDGVEQRSKCLDYREFSSDYDDAPGLFVRRSVYRFRVWQRLLVLWNICFSEARCIFRLGIYFLILPIGQCCRRWCLWIDQYQTPAQKDRLSIITVVLSQRQNTSTST